MDAMEAEASLVAVAKVVAATGWATVVVVLVAVVREAEEPMADSWAAAGQKGAAGVATGVSVD